jgi:hypothetical protein
LRQCPSRYAIRAGRNFAFFLCSQRGRLCLHLVEALRDRLRRLLAGSSSGASPPSSGSATDRRETGQSFVEGPRIAPIVDLRSVRLGIREESRTVRSDRSFALRLSRYGAIPLAFLGCEAVGFPRHYPSTIASSLHETVGLGSAVMSGLSLRVASEQGK